MYAWSSRDDSLIELVNTGMVGLASLQQMQQNVATRDSMGAEVVVCTEDGVGCLHLFYMCCMRARDLPCMEG